MAIEIQQEQVGSVRLLALGGRFDTETAVDVELALQDLLAAGEREFLIDLSGIGYVSSAGLRVLLSLAKQLDGGKGSLRLCGLNAAVTQVFDVAGFSKLFAIFPDRAAALPTVAHAKPEASLGQKAAALMGLKTNMVPPHPHAAELARSAAILLGIKPMAVTKPAAGGKVASAAPARAVTASTSPPAASGILGKLRGLFGGKR